MKKRIKHVSVSQCAKMMAAIYFLLSLPFVAVLVWPALTAAEVPGLGIGLLVLIPFVYALFTYLAGALTAWIYKLVAARIGGFEFTTAEVSS